MKQNALLLQTQFLDINMPLYTFKNLETNEEYDEVMSYEELQKYLTQDDITKYPYVEIEWLDIEGDAGWSSTKQLNLEQLPTCVSKGYLLSQKNGVTRIFTDYIKSKDKPTFEDIGNTTIIPTAVIKNIKKIL